MHITIKIEDAFEESKERYMRVFMEEMKGEKNIIIL